jgi:MYXO-CTERM domain-containing protein
LINRYLLGAAMGAAMFLSGATTASAGSTNIQFTDLRLTNGVGANAVSTVTFDEIPQPGTFTASANFTSLPGEFKFSEGFQLIDVKFNPQIERFASSALYLGSAISWTVVPAFIPTGQVVTDVTLSLSSSNLRHGSGTYAGTITIDTSAVPEPSSVIMALTALIAFAGLGVRRARRRCA